MLLGDAFYRSTTRGTFSACCGLSIDFHRKTFDSMLRISLKRLLIVFAAFAMIVSMAILLELAGKTECRLSSYTKIRLQKLDAAIRANRADRGPLPASLDELLLAEVSGQGPYARESDLRDAWLREFYYRRSDRADAYVLFSLGKDGAIGGDGEDADIGIEGSASAD